MIDPAILQRTVVRLGRLLAPPAGPLVPWVVDGSAIGWLDPVRAERVLAFREVFARRDGAVAFVPSLADPASRTDALDAVARTLASEGALSAWRDERYAVASGFEGPPLFRLERAAARYFGIRTWAAHANGLALERGVPCMWIARRSTTKAIDPARLDNLVAGGIAAGSSVGATLVKEAWEEASVPAALAHGAEPSGSVHIRRAQPDGLQRETIFVHDLALPEGFEPVNQDGEVSAFRKVGFDEAARLIAQDSGPDEVTADASLVIADCLLRRGWVPPADPAFARLAALRVLGLDD